ncbi:MAG: hypothetical protein IM584_09035 [Chitinophagaceae bacterium]|nr:hypothetical protein [Chitinophagaceae bacterium]MCA6456263.1 hypothetical protein [Chitinophagaceae bacterium]MCA6460517.1 hypothetical protein [Chitinophagaceae bacterium]MCA6464137.1 hypothetical protein [Chitinophagaceae bacterium]MEA3427257.1 hypothetical protein [Bacteroidota bacterium]
MIKTGKYLSILVICLLTFRHANAQSYPDLQELTGFSIKAYYSPGNAERAKIIVARCERTINYVKTLVGFTPTVSVFILNPEHWKKYASFPVYGMPHYPDNERLFIASEDNAFWKSFIPPIDQLSPEMATRVKNAYKTADGKLSMMAFFDLLALHELGHAFHQQVGLTMQRLWMQELFCNIMLHTYIAEKEPANLPALETFPEMVVAGGTTGYQYTTLAGFEKIYDKMDPKNYGWYQCRLHVAGKHIYNAGGPNAFIKLWKGLKEHKEQMTDEQFASFLNKNVDGELGKVQTDW